MGSERDSNFDKIIGLALLGLLLIIIAIIAAIAVYSSALPGSAGVREELGQAGDYFGGMLNPVFAFFSFIALLYTIVLQTNEMKAAREEAQASRVEAQNSVAALKSQVEHLKTEAKKADLYKMIELVADELESWRSAIIVLTGSIFAEGNIDLLFGPKRDERMFRELPTRDNESRNDAIEEFDRFADSITELAFLLDDYMKNNGDNSVIIHYSRRYGSYARSLYEKGYLGSVARNVFIASRYTEQEP